jgi:hypothetical protein
MCVCMHVCISLFLLSLRCMQAYELTDDDVDRAEFQRGSSSEQSR